MSHGCLSGRPYPRDTRETQLSPFGLTLRIRVMCKAHAFFRGMLSRELPAKPLQSSVAWVFILSVSNTQPLQWNPTINTGYKRMNNITIKFGTEYKPTKHNVVNNNYPDTLCIATILPSGDFRRVVGREVFMPRAWVFLFHDTCGVMCVLLVFVSTLFSSICCHACVE